MRDADYFPTAQRTHSPFTLRFQCAGQPCDAEGNFLPPGAPPSPRPEKVSNDWSPFEDRAQFELADLLYTQIQMSAHNVDNLLEIFSAYLHKHGDQPPFGSCDDLYNTIDRIQVGNIAWNSFGVKFCGDRTENPLPWMDDVYDVWMREPESAITHIIGDADFKNTMDYVPYREYDTATDARRWQNFMSGDWAWEEAVSSPVILLQSTVSYRLFYRMSLPKMLRLMEQHCYLSFSALTRPRYLSQPGNMTTIHFTFPSVTFTILRDAPIRVASNLLHS